MGSEPEPLNSLPSCGVEGRGGPSITFLVLSRHIQVLMVLLNSFYTVILVVLLLYVLKNSSQCLTHPDFLFLIWVWKAEGK